MRARLVGSAVTFLRDEVVEVVDQLGSVGSFGDDLVGVRRRNFAIVTYVKLSELEPLDAEAAQFLAAYRCAAKLRRKE